MKKKIIDILLRILMFPAPKIHVTSEEKVQFDRVYESAFENIDHLIHYNLPIPKYKFLFYLSENKDVIFHGSNHSSIHLFEPKNQTLFDGKQTKAVFATRDPIWSIFYAVFRKESLVSNFRNGCMSATGKQKYHFYSLTHETIKNQPWSSGYVYILPVHSFQHVGKGSIIFDEWISKEPVSPIVKLEVEPKDFYFLQKVAAHHQQESLMKSWMLYKLRVFVKGKRNNSPNTESK